MRDVASASRIDENVVKPLRARAPVVIASGVLPSLGSDLRHPARIRDESAAGIDEGLAVVGDDSWIAVGKAARHGRRADDGKPRGQRLDDFVLHADRASEWGDRDRALLVMRQHGWNVREYLDAGRGRGEPIRLIPHDPEGNAVPVGP